MTANENVSFTDDRIGKTFKGIEGAGRLTQKVILRIQGHYGAYPRTLWCVSKDTMVRIQGHYGVYPRTLWCVSKDIMVRIQGHYGAAIRENHDSLTEMKKAIWQIWSHYADDHIDCKDQCPVKSGKGPSKISLLKFVCQQIKPVFEKI